MSPPRQAVCAVGPVREAASASDQRLAVRGAAVGITPEATVSLRVVRGLLEAVERMGVPRSQLLQRGGLRPEQLDAEEGRLARARMYALCEAAMELTRDPALGLHWAEHLNDGAFVPVAHLVNHAPSLRQALDALGRFYALLSDQPSYRRFDGREKVTLQLLPLTGVSLGVQRFCAEMMTLGLVRLVGHFSQHARSELVGFAYAAPAYHAEYARVFQRQVRFAQPATSVVFDRALLDAPAPHRDADVHEVLRDLAERRLWQFTQSTPYALRVRDLLVRCGGAHRTDMKAAAQALGLSVRSLRRRLGEEGKPYAAIATEAFAIVAGHLLRDKHLTVQETASAMGFSDASAFHRAFRRWTGTTPNAYRRAPEARS